MEIGIHPNISDPKSAKNAERKSNWIAGGAIIRGGVASNLFDIPKILNRIIETIYGV